MNIWTTGLVIFFARILDVSFGTVRTILTVQGRIALSFLFGICEVVIWILVVSTVINQVKESPILILFYATGYATGNVVGILVEQKLAFGLIILRVITKRTEGLIMANRIRNLGQPVTIFTGQGMKGTVLELNIVCHRRDFKKLLPVIMEEDPNAFYITEQARDVSKIFRPFDQPVNGWRTAFNKK